MQIDPATITERLGGTLSELLGIRFVETSADRVVAELPYREALTTVGGGFHGGTLMALADTLGAVATVLNLPSGAGTTTLESKTNFLAAARSGHGARGDHPDPPGQAHHGVADPRDRRGRAPALADHPDPDGPDLIAVPRSAPASFAPDRGERASASGSQAAMPMARSSSMVRASSSRDPASPPRARGGGRGPGGTAAASGRISSAVAMSSARPNALSAASRSARCASPPPAPPGAAPTPRRPARRGCARARAPPRRAGPPRSRARRPGRRRRTGRARGPGRRED